MSEHRTKIIPSNAAQLGGLRIFFVTCRCGWFSTKDPTLDADYDMDGLKYVQTRWQAERLAEQHMIRSIPQRYSA